MLRIASVPCALCAIAMLLLAPFEAAARSGGADLVRGLFIQGHISERIAIIHRMASSLLSRLMMHPTSSATLSLPELRLLRVSPRACPCPC
jgi:hypothetical protein